MSSNKEKLIFAALGLGMLVATATPVILRTARGLRNNNPGNIRHGDRWQGMAPEQNDDSFIQFVSPLFGIRAMTIILRNYQKRHGLQTIRQFINRWAPPNENDTDSYVNAVSKATGIPPDDPISVNNMKFVSDLIKSIIKHENGSQPYSDQTIKQGILLA